MCMTNWAHVLHMIAMFLRCFVKLQLLHIVAFFKVSSKTVGQSKYTGGGESIVSFDSSMVDEAFCAALFLKPFLSTASLIFRLKDVFCVNSPLDCIRYCSMLNLLEKWEKPRRAPSVIMKMMKRLWCNNLLTQIQSLLKTLTLLFCCLTSTFIYFKKFQYSVSIAPPSFSVPAPCRVTWGNSMWELKYTQVWNKVPCES